MFGTKKEPLQPAPPQPRQLTPEEWMDLVKHFIGNNYRYRENIIIPKTLGPVKIKTNEEKMVEAIFESCPFKSVMSCVIGKQITKSETKNIQMCLYRLWSRGCYWTFLI